MSWKRKTAIGLVAAFGVLNLGALIGHLGNKPQKPQQVEIVYPPAGEYTSYTVTVNEDGSYTIDYRAHDPSLTTSETYTDSSNGAFGIGGRSTTTITREHIATEGGVVDEGKLTAEQIECIKAVGGGESNGALVGSSIATSMTPLVSSIPYVGWLATGWLVMFGQNIGSDIGGQVASNIKGC